MPTNASILPAASLTVSSIPPVFVGLLSPSTKFIFFFSFVRAVFFEVFDV